MARSAEVDGVLVDVPQHLHRQRESISAGRRRAMTAELAELAELVGCAG
ncbi:hypothetical protein [Micromonospora sp. NPDC092111]